MGHELTTGGWVLVAMGWGGTITLVIYCMSKVFGNKNQLNDD